MQTTDNAVISSFSTVEDSLLLQTAFSPFIISSSALSVLQTTDNAVISSFSAFEEDSLLLHTAFSPFIISSSALSVLQIADNAVISSFSDFEEDSLFALFGESFVPIEPNIFGIRKVLVLELLVLLRVGGKGYSFLELYAI